MREIDIANGMQQVKESREHTQKLRDIFAKHGVEQVRREIRVNFNLEEAQRLNDLYFGDEKDEIIHFHLNKEIKEFKTK